MRNTLARCFLVTLIAAVGLTANAQVAERPTISRQDLVGLWHGMAEVLDTCGSIPAGAASNELWYFNSMGPSSMMYMRSVAGRGPNVIDIVNGGRGVRIEGLVWARDRALFCTMQRVDLSVVSNRELLADRVPVSECSVPDGTQEYEGPRALCPGVHWRIRFRRVSP